jgi:pSer/pThr/pTyr-binding forkhead associated (FHA) protein
MAKIQVFFGGTLQSECFLDDKASITVGRSSECDIVIDNLAVSRHHCTLKGLNREWVVEDNRSSNGTFVNGEPIAVHLLKHQDRIVVGKHTLLFDEFDSSEAQQPVAAPAAAAEPVASDSTMFVRKDALAQYKQRSQKEKPMVLVLDGARRLTVPLDKEVTVIGKGRQCDLCIKGWFVRDEQATVVRQRGAYKVVHQGGMRGMRVNGAKTREIFLQAGDVITIAGNKISFGSL